MNEIEAHSRKINLYSGFKGKIRTHHKKRTAVNYYSVDYKASKSADDAYRKLVV